MSMSDEKQNDSANDDLWHGEGDKAVVETGDEPVLIAVVETPEEREEKKRLEKERQERERLKLLERESAERKERLRKEEEEDERRVRELEERARRARNGVFDIAESASSESNRLRMPRKKVLVLVGVLVILSLVGWIGKYMESESSQSESAKVDNSVSNEESQDAESYLGKWIDPRNSQKYRTRRIGSLVWLLDNMNYPYSGSFCYNDDNENCKKYGRLYSWSDAQSVCVAPWRLPSKSDWNDLELKIGLQSANPWKSDFFNAQAGGFRSKKGKFELIGRRADFWSSDAFDDNSAYYYYFVQGEGEVYSNKYSKGGAMSVRCVKSL